MPSLLTDAEVDEGRLGEALNAAPSAATTLNTVLGMGQLTPLAVDALRGLKADTVRGISADDANRDYGVDGYLKFEKATTDVEAARKSAGAHRRAFTEDVLGRAKVNPLAQIGGAMVGGLFDPVALPLFVLPEVMGLRAGLEGAVATRGVFAGAGRLANAGRGMLVGAGEGVAATSIYEAANYGLRRYSGDDDYDLGDSLVNLLLGGVLGAGIGGVVGGVVGDAHPRAVRKLPPESRRGAVAVALDDAMGDRPVSVAPLIEREAADQEAGRAARQGSASLLDETGAEPTIRARPLEEAVAVTTRGAEIPVRYAIVELGDLVTSHDDDLVRNPAFPEGLQPRDRTRAGSQAGNLRLESELNPKRLMRESGAETGAPLVSPDGTVESGNGRTIALRRSATRGTPAWDRYKAELEAQGFDTEGFSNPVLVRIRTQPMTGEGRVALARDMNAAPTEAMGPAEQAAADAGALDDAQLALIDGTAQGDRAFARAFIAKVAPDQQNTLADAHGQLSAVGQNRIKAALVARAYDDPRLVEAVFEVADPNIKTLGAALADAAPTWARMRSLASRGEIPAALDITPHLRAAVDLIRHARDNKIPVDEWIAQRLDQAELFGGNAIEPETEAFLRLFFRDGTFRGQRSADKIAWALKDYARQASEVTPGPNLFGDVPDGDAKLILEGLAAKFARNEPFPAAGDLLDVGPPKPAEPVVVDLRPDAGDGGGEGLQPAGGGVAEGAGRGRADPLAGVDEELKALAAEDLADAGDAKPNQDPATIAEAIRAAAFCLSEGQ